MQEFKDCEGRSWTVAVTVATVKRCRQLLSFDLLDAENALQRIMCDPITLCDVLFVCCKPQADERGVTDEDFARAMAGDVIARAKRALVDDLISFFESPEDRKNLRAAIEKFNVMTDRMRALIGRRLEGQAIDREIEAALSRVEADLDMAIGSGRGSGNWPESSVSSQAP